MSTPHKQERYDVVVVGAGHNGLVAAGYLARAGLQVLVLERLGVTGGAVVSHQPFPGLLAKMSPYAYAVSLLPDQITKDLGLDMQFRPTRTRAFAPTARGGAAKGLLVEREPTELTRTSFRDLTGSDEEFQSWQSFHARLIGLAQGISPTLLEPLMPAEEMRERVDPQLWAELVEEPLSALVERTFADDLVRGIVASSGLFGTFTDLRSPDLHANRTFLYQMVGNGTGERRVPLGGMGSVAGSLERCVWRNHGEILTAAFVSRVDTDGRSAQVAFRHDGQEHTVECRFVLGDIAPWVLDILVGESPGPRPEGGQLVVNMLLERLPRLRCDVAPAVAFAGTCYVASGYDELLASYAEAASGAIPKTPPGELFCHSLTDPSALGTLAMEGKHAFTYLMRNAPARLYSGQVPARRDESVHRILDAVNQHLSEPLESLLSLAADGSPCLVASAPQDIEATLAMPGGHMFHGPLSWPWATDDTPLETPAQRWGVNSGHANILVCGAGSRRAGGVSGIGGHNAAMALLEMLGRSA